MSDSVADGLPKESAVSSAGKSLVMRLVAMTALVALALHSTRFQNPATTDLVAKTHTVAGKNGTSSSSSNSIQEQSASLQPVQWITDSDWFNTQAKRGCCPFPAVIYEHRYAHIHFRCCDDRLDELEPLRPFGGISFDNNPIVGRLSHTSTLLQGDSLAEQHFLSLLCLAWRDFVSVDLQLEKDSNDDLDHLDSGTTWRAVIGSVSNESALVHNMTIRYTRVDTPELDDASDYTAHDFVVLGGWHHGKLELLDQFLTDMTAVRAKRPTIVVEALPSHFPGGKYQRDDVYPPANGTDGVCDKVTLRADPAINMQLRRKIKSSKKRDQLYLLGVQHLYMNRGDAHIGSTGIGAVGLNGRDCLHFCFAPGVLDALAMQTLKVMISILT